MKQSLAKPPTIPWIKSIIWGFPGDSVVKHPPVNAGDTGDAGLMPGWEDPLEKKKKQPTPIFLPRKSKGQRSTVGYSLRGHKRVGFY